MQLVPLHLLYSLCVDAASTIEDPSDEEPIRAKFCACSFS